MPVPPVFERVQLLHFRRRDHNDLEAAFKRFGEVLSAQVLTDRETGRSRGFGFVELSDEDARRAIDEMDGADLAGRRIVVNESRPMPARPPRQDRGGGDSNYR
jgi:RNA recognition motif-containing protein